MLCQLGNATVNLSQRNVAVAELAAAVAVILDLAKLVH
jgi:hypothetical protein